MRIIIISILMANFLFFNSYASESKLSKSKMKLVKQKHKSIVNIMGKYKGKKTLIK